MADTVKQRHLEGVIRKDLSEIIQFEMKDPLLGFVTITDVKVSRDHSYATVYVTFLGKGYNKKQGMEALERGKGFIRSQLASMLDIRRTPELIFKEDEAYERGRHIDDIIDSIHSVSGVKTAEEKNLEIIKKADKGE